LRLGFILYDLLAEWGAVNPVRIPCPERRRKTGRHNQAISRIKP
jgi:hypothetical protein